MNRESRVEKHELQRQFLLFRITNFSVDIIAWAFFSILIYKQVGGYMPIFLAFIMINLGFFTSFTIYSFLVDRLGYLSSYRGSMIINAITATLFAVFINDFASVYLFLAFLRGFAMGTFWPTVHLYMVKEVHNAERSSIINLLESIALLLQVFIPAIAGSMIAYTGSYQATFILSAIIYLFGALYPFEVNKKTQSRIQSSEISRILKRPYIGRFLFLQFANMSINNTVAVMMTILPYVFIGSEFGVGVLTSIIGIFAALASFYEKDKSRIIKERLALTSWSIYSIVNIIFVIIWTTPLLVVRSLVLPFTIALGDTSKLELDSTLREKILGDFRDESTLEMNMIIETVFLFARIIPLVVIYFLMSNFQEHTESMIRIIVGVGTASMTIIYIAFKSLNKAVRIA